MARQEIELGKGVERLRRLQNDLDEYCDVLRQRQRMGSNVQAQIDEAEEKSTELKGTD